MIVLCQSRFMRVIITMILTKKIKHFSIKNEPDCFPLSFICDRMTRLMWREFACECLTKGLTTVFEHRHKIVIDCGKIVLKERKQYSLKLKPFINTYLLRIQFPIYRASRVFSLTFTITMNGTQSNSIFCLPKIFLCINCSLALIWIHCVNQWLFIWKLWFGINREICSHFDDF